MTEATVHTWRRWVPAAAAAVALLLAAAALLVVSPGGLQRSPARMLLRGLAAPGSRMALATPADGDVGTMRFVAGGADPLAATALIRGVPTQRMTAPDLGFSQAGEDLVAWQTYFHGQHNGTFLEMGALDGYRFSNTLFFEAFLGWTGLLVEPGVAAFERLTANRPNATKAHAAVCDKAGVVHFLERGVGLGEIYGILEFMPDAYKAMWHADATLEQGTEVRCVPLRQLLAEAGLRHVNFFSLDVEGAELTVLKTIDFAAVTFDVIVLETDGHDHVKDAQCVQLLTDNGYHKDAIVKQNTWFVRDGFKPSRQPGSGSG